MKILSPDAVDDTLQAIWPSSLALEVHDSSGGPAAAATVTLRSRRGAGNAYLSPAALFSVSPGTDGVEALTEVTDSRGHVSARVRLGFFLGSGWIIADAGPLGRDSIRVDIRHGAPAMLALAPGDTALAVGVSCTPTFVVRDRGANVLADIPSFVSRRADVATIVGGRAIQSAAIGRAYVVGTVGTAVDSVGISVVPSGTLIAFAYIYSSGDVSKVATFDLDGSNYQRTLLPTIGYNDFSPHWLPQQNTLVFHASGPGFGNEVGLFTMDASNQPTVLLRSLPDSAAAYPQPARDGAWVYYTQQLGYGRYEIWRIRLDGSARARVGPQSSSSRVYSYASPSPDGRAIAYASFPVGGGDPALNRLDLASGVESPVGVFGTHPRWSPVSDEIAYFTGGTLHVVQADGTGDHRLATNTSFDDTYGQVDWSPDGRWLVACATGEFLGVRRLALVARASGEVLPLPFSSRDNLCDATWKR